MSEFLKNTLDNLNNYAGLFSLFAVLASIIVPCIIYKKENKVNYFMAMRSMSKTQVE